jgi:long-chain fatty acid transport protein
METFFNHLLKGTLMARRCVLLVVLAMCGTTILPAGGFQLNEHGARGVGMGGAYAARANDPSAIFVNPAGLSFLTGLQFYGGTTVVAPSVRFRGLYPDNPVPETKMVSNLFFPSNVYLTYTSSSGLAFGIGMFNMFGLGSEWPDLWAGAALSEKIDLKTYFINPTVAYRVNQWISVGAGYSYVPSSVLITKYIKPGFVDPTGNPVEPFLSLDGTGHGTNWNVGVILTPTEDLNIGASYRSKTTIALNGTITFTNVPASLASNFPDGPGTATLKTPANIYVGVSYRVLPSLTAEADYQFSGWSVYDSLKVNLTNPVGGQSSIASPRNYQDVYLLRFGLEYQMNTDLTLRAGYIFDKNPVPNGYVEPGLPDADRNDFTVGFGYRLTNALRLDMSYMFVRFNQRTESQSIPQNSFNGTYNSTASLFSIDLAYSFE